MAFVGDVVGTGSSRKSATNSVLWYFGEDTPASQIKSRWRVYWRQGRAHFYNTMEDAGALVLRPPVDALGMGDVIEIRPYDGKILAESGDVLSEFSLRSDVLLDEVRAGGRINLIIGRGLTGKARGACLVRPIYSAPRATRALRQRLHAGAKMVGRACGVEGFAPAPTVSRMTTVGSQDTTGPMTRDELQDLACLAFRQT